MIVPVIASRWWLLTAVLGLGCVGSIDAGPGSGSSQSARPGSTAPGNNSPGIGAAGGTTGTGTPGAGSAGTGTPGMPGMMPGAPHDPTNDPVCTPAAGGQAAAARVVRLTKPELANTLADLVGMAAPAALEIEGDPLVLGYSTGAGRSVSTAYAEGMKQIATSTATAFRAQLAATCTATDAAARACADTFIRDFGKRAFRRAMAADEITALLDIYDKGRELGATMAVADRMRSGLEVTVRTILQAPSFIYRAELGDPAAANGVVAKLTPFELATLLSYTLIASPPDAELLRAAEAGQLASAAEVAAQGKRLTEAKPERFKDQVRRFVTEWLGIDFQRSDWDKNTRVYPQYTPELKEAYKQELVAFVGDWAAGATAPLDRLLISPEVYANRVSAPIYELMSTSMTVQKVAADATRRAGILTQGAFLGTHAHPDSSAPIERGLFIRENLFCTPRPQIPADVPPVPATKPGEAKTTRQRFDGHIQANGGACVGCHAVFNPMGYPFESYDGIGKYRTMENGVAVDTSGAIVGTPNSDRPVANAVELAQALAKSADVHACFATQVFRYTAGRAETPYDTCSLARATGAYVRKGLDLKELLNTLLGTDSYSLRRIAKEAP